MPYIVLFSIIFTINVGISTYFVYYKYMNRNEEMFLDMIMLIKQQIININEKQISIKNRTSYFYNDIINLKNFKSNKNRQKALQRD